MRLAPLRRWAQEGKGSCGEVGGGAPGGWRAPGWRMLSASGGDRSKVAQAPLPTRRRRLEGARMTFVRCARVAVTGGLSGREGVGMDAAHDTSLIAPPATYRYAGTIDLKRDRRAAVVVQVVFAVVTAGFVGAAVLLDIPLRGRWPSGVVVAVTLATCLVYTWLHEATHGLLLTVLSGARSRYAVRLPYLTCGNDAFVSRRAFLAIALGPLVLWGALLAALLAVAPADLHLTLYVLTGLNVAGSAGDLYQARVAADLPRNALLRDDGRMTTILVPDVGAVATAERPVRAPADDECRGPR